VKIAFYASKPMPDGKGIPTFALTLDDKDGKGGEFDRFRIHNDKEHVEVTVRGKVAIEHQTDQTIIRLQDCFGDFIVRQR